MFSPLSHKIVFPDTPLYNHPQSLKSSHSKNKTNNREQPIQRLIIFVPTRTKHVNNMRNKYLLSLLAALGFSGLDNIINELFDDVTENEEIENEVEEENTQKENSNTENEENTNELDNEENEIEEEDISSTETVTSKEQKAINLVKKAWGGDDGVYLG